MVKKLLLAAALLVFTAAACNLPAAQPTVEVPTAPAETPAEPTTEAPTQTPPPTPTTVPPASTATSPPPTDPPPTEAGPERVRFETGAISATVDGTAAAGEADEYLIYALEDQEMSVELVTAGDLVLEVIAPDDEVLADEAENLTAWTGTLPGTGDYLVRVVSQAGTDVPYVLTFVIPPLGDDVAEACNFTVETPLTAYRWASTASDVFGTADAGLELVAQYETPDGWLGFDPAVAQAPNFGVDRMRWIQPSEGDITFEPDCPGLPVVLSLEQLRNASYRAMEFEPVTLEDGRYEDRSDPARWQVTVLRENAMSYTDIDSDGDEDSIVVLVTNTGGSGSFVELAAVRNDDGEPEYMSKVFIGDRTPIHHMTVIDGVLHVQATIHDEDDPLCCPSQDVTLMYRFEDGEFVVEE